MNKWGIDPEVERRVRKRDKRCVYCHAAMKERPRARGVPRNKATWEHIDNNDLRSDTNVVRCCGACNTSKGAKRLSDWFESEYCKRKKINETTVSAVVKNWLSNRRHITR